MLSTYCNTTIIIPDSLKILPETISISTPWELEGVIAPH
jgi:hypothetical protein